MVIKWLTCRHEQTVDYDIVQTLNLLPQGFLSQTGWNSHNFWTRKTQNLSTFQVFQSFSHKCKSLFLQSCPKEFVRFLCECIVNLLKGNLQSIKRQQVTKFQNKVRLLSLKTVTRKQRREVLASRKVLQLIKVITPPFISHLSWHRAVFSRSCFCIQQGLEYPINCKART